MRILVWDLPVRLFHWLLAGSFLAAFLIAVSTDDDGTLFPVHALFGLVMGFVVVLRLVWGFVGTTHARFTAFAWSPAALVAYLRDAFSPGAARRWVGHNPGSSWASAVIFACALGLGATGIAMSSGSEVAEEVHEVLAWTLLATVGAHLAGLAWHTLRHREAIGLAMVDGRKVGDPGAAIRSARPLAGLAFLALTGAWTGGLVNGYDPATATVTLPGIGTRIALGEGGEGGEGGDHHDDDDE